jgi:hypothetical protein
MAAKTNSNKFGFVTRAEVQNVQVLLRAKGFNSRWTEKSGDAGYVLTVSWVEQIRDIL